MSELLSRCTPCPHCGGSVVTDGVTDFCQGCGRTLQRCEVWSRIVGYLRPTRNYADHKKLEFKQRKLYDIPTTDQLRDLDPALLSGVPRGAGPGQ